MKRLLILTMLLVPFITEAQSPMLMLLVMGKKKAASHTTPAFYLANSGSDAASGDLGYPWKTIAKLATANLNPGDSFFFNGGDRWAEQLIVTHSGSALSPIVFTSYGSGAKPIIDGADSVSGFSSYTGNKYFKKGFTTGVQSVWFNDTVGVDKKNTASLAADKDWCWKTDTLFVYSSSAPAARYTSSIMAGQRSYTVYDGNAAISYITLRGLDLRHGNDTTYGSVQIVNGSGSHWTIDSCNLWYTPYFAIYANANSVRITADSIRNCGRRYELASAGTGNAINLYNNTTNAYVGYNYIDHCGGGIEVHSLYSRIEYNTVRWNQRHGCYIGSQGNRDTLIYNKFIDNDQGIPFDPGASDDNNWMQSKRIYYAYNVVAKTVPDSLSRAVSVIGVDSCEFYNNTIYGFTYPATPTKLGFGFLFESDATTGQCAGNIVKNNIVTQTDYPWAYSGTVDTSTFFVQNTFDYNCYNHTTSGTDYFIGGVGTYSVYQIHQLRTGGQEAHSFSLDPGLTSASDYHLTDVSNCKNVGTNVSITKDIDGNTVPANTVQDLGAYENQTALAQGSLQVGGGSNDVIDTNPSSGSPDTPRDTGQDPTNKQWWIYRTTVGGDMPALVRVDLSSIPHGATIDSADIQIYITQIVNGAGLLQLWNTGNYFAVPTSGTIWGAATATYNNYDGTHAWTGGHDGGEGDRKDSCANTVTTLSTGWRKMSFISNGTSWLQTQFGGFANVLMRILYSTTTGNTELIVNSAHYTTNSTLRPKFNVYYHY